MSEHPDDLEACHRLIDQLREALESRDLIGQAKGLLMAHQKVDAAEAFALLVQASQHRNQKLRDVAACVVAANTTGLAVDDGTWSAQVRLARPEDATP